MSPRYFSIGTYILTALMVLTLAACGGGGDSERSAPTATSDTSKLDTTAPVITIKGDKSVQVVLGNNYVELGASATDETDGEVAVTISGNLNLNQLGTYTITYAAADKAGNAASAQRTVLVVAPKDEAAPEVSVNGDSNVTLNYGETYQELGATAIDNVDGKVEVTISGQVDVNNPDIYTITYSATDKAGNSGTASRIVTVLPQQDTNAPVLSLNGDDYIKLFVGESYVELGAVAIDDVDGQLNASFSGVVNTEIPGTYTITYTATDKAGNSASIERVIDVAVQREFITTWKTDNVELGSTDEYTIKIGTIGEGYNFQVDWGDGNIDTNVTSAISHRYQSAGTYTIKITGDFPRFYFDETEYDRNKIISVEQWGDIRWSSMERAFFNCANLVVNALDAPDLSNVTDLSYMFGYAVSFDQSIEHWDVSNVENMTAMFQGAWNFNQPIGNWNVSNVVNMAYMFNEAYKFNQPLNDWDVSNVKDMLHMFNRASDFNQPIGNWDVSQVYRMSGLFSYAESFNQDIGEWDTSEVFYMSYMFNEASSFNQDIGLWDVSGVAYMNSLFRNATAFDQNLRSWDISNLVDMRSMFQGIALSVENYDALLQGWSELPNPPQQIGFHAGDSKYSQLGKAARDILTDIHRWNIADGGPNE
ncbi:BspA family leucine-rich repeat surface protein [Pseudoalteromonas rubra]|uniref:PKD domain-containing protein n=1 Tax=Pseudoalteromonas rubra TaxID=43658 RepID=A0A5S3WSF4_9GAMM|nr:BspA family leucine-rich repeat surface protein [Pseudoalteromonas rubra]TMP31316.1 hypothetical protein CWB98_22685 [Pseudoalteromonas rubra]